MLGRRFDATLTAAARARAGRATGSAPPAREPTSGWSRSTEARPGTGRILANTLPVAPRDAARGTSVAPSVFAHARASIGRLLVQAALLATAAVALAAYEHFKLHGASAESTGALFVAAGLALSPVRAVARELLAIEGKLLHAVHGLGGLAVVGLTCGGVISGRPVLDQAALAPFAIIGAAQAVRHRPRTLEQGAALQRFVTSLSQVRQLTRSGALGDVTQVRRSAAVLTDVVAKAQSLGETELRSDPAFQSALRRATLRLGVSLGLDTVEAAIVALAANPVAASAVPELRTRLAAARHSIDPDSAPGGAPALSGSETLRGTGPSS